MAVGLPAGAGILRTAWEGSLMLDDDDSSFQLASQDAITMDFYGDGCDRV